MQSQKKVQEFVEAPWVHSGKQGKNKFTGNFAENFDKKGYAKGTEDMNKQHDAYVCKLK